MAPLPDAALLLDQILAGIGQPFYALDRDFRFVLFNDEAARYFERPAETVLGRVVWDVFPWDREHERGRVLREAMATRRLLKGEILSTMRARLVAYCVFPLGDGIGAVLRDVSDRRDAEAALHQRTAELEAVLGTVPVAVWFTNDPAGRMIARNRRATEMLRVPPDERLLSVAPNQLFRFEQDGAVLPLDRLPLQRALRGETIDDELMDLVHDDGERRTLLIRAEPLRGPDGVPVGSVCVAADVTERHRYESQLRLLLDELNHRVKNTLAIVQSIANVTLKDVEPAAREQLSQRLFNLAAVHGLLTEASWEGAALDEVLRASLRLLEPREERVRLDGPPLRLQPRTAVTLSLAVHELVTNALKYGALSLPDGHVEVRWTVEGPRFRLSWCEHGGPPVTPPGRTGFGTRMIRQALAAELRGEARMDFHADGLVCTIDGEAPTVPADR